MQKRKSGAYMSSGEQIAGTVFFAVYLLVLPFAAKPLFGLAELLLGITLSGDMETLIYYYNGALCENYQAAGRSFAPEAGEPITEIAQVVFQEEDPGLLFLRILDFEGNWHGIHLNVRQEREG